MFAIKALVLASALALAFTLACGDDDGGSGSGSGSASASAGEVKAGVIEAKPANATQVDIVLREWAIANQPTTVSAGAIYFLVDNQGPEDPHEFVIIQSDLAIDKLATEKGKVPENKVKLIGEIEPFSPKTKAAKTFSLAPGKYVLICNIAEMEQGRLESHYELGMRTSFTVQ